MCYQLANPVSQRLRHVADRWRPQLSCWPARIVGVAVLAARRPRAERWVLALLLVAGGLGGAASSARRGARPRYAGRQRGLSMSFHITSGELGQAMAPLIFAPSCRSTA